MEKSEVEKLMGPDFEKAPTAEDERIQRDRLDWLIKIEEHGAEHGWVTPLTDEDRQYFRHFRAVLKRYNINPSTATKLEYEFVIRVAEAEFYGVDAGKELDS